MRLASKNLISVVGFLILVILFFEWESLLGLRVTSWDTHNLGFVNFIYFSDVLKSGEVPFWNPFIQSGTYFPSFNNLGLFTLFQFPFAILANYLSPIIVYEWLIKIVVLIGGIGTYKFFRSAKVEHDLACLGSVIFIATTLIPNVGQLGFVFSLATLPWVLFAAHSIVENKTRIIIWPILGIFFGFAMASGYIWMNVVNYAILVGYTLLILKLDSRYTTHRFLWFLGSSALSYVILLAPAYFYFKFNYTNFLGDYVSPEPILRSLKDAMLVFNYQNLLMCINASNTLISMIKILINPVLFKMPFVGWNLGAGLVLTILLVNAWLKKSSVKPVYYYWICLIIIGLFYAGGIKPIFYLAKYLPVFNENRWWILGLDYSVFCLIILTIIWTQDSFGKEPLKLSNSLLFYFPFISLALVYISIPWYQYAIIVGVFAVMTIDYFTSNRNRQIVFFMCFVVFETSMTLKLWANTDTYGTPYFKSSIYMEQIKQRKIAPSVLNINDKKVSAKEFYSVDSDKWYLDKIPVSGGYDNLGPPIYWYIKNTPVNTHFFSIAAMTRPENVIRRADYSNDNSYVNAIVADILLNTITPTSDQSSMGLSNRNGTVDIILDTKIEPNKSSVKVKTAGAAVVIFNNNYAPGWGVYIDGKKAPIIKINYLFMGVKVSSSGLHIVEFIFKPIITMISIGLLYAVLLILCLYYLITYKFSEKLI